MDNILALSGIFAILIPTIFVVIPYANAYRKYKTPTFSQFVLINKRDNKLFAFGLLATSITQILFGIFLINELGVSYIPISVLLYSVGCFSFGILGFVRVDKHTFIHDNLARAYFFFTLLSLPIAFLELKDVNSTYSFFCGFIIIIAILLIIISLVTGKSKLKIEIIHSIISYIWIIGVYAIFYK